MRITESQLRRIIKQEVRSLHEGPGRKGRKGRMDTQTEVNVDGALGLWRDMVAVTNARQALKDAEYMAKGITRQRVDAALGEAIATMQGLGMTPEEIEGYIYERATAIGFRPDDARDIADTAFDRMRGAARGY